MKEIKRIQIENKDTADISSMIEVVLAANGYTNELKIRYSFIFEEVLLGWKEKYPENQPVDFVRYESAKDFRYEISIKGKKDNPLQESTSDDASESLISIMKTGVGQELGYRYANGENIVSITLPKEKQERKLFERNMTRLSIPVILQLLVLNLASVLDTVMLSFYSDVALSAASLVSQYTVLFNAIITALGTGMTVVLSKYWTKRDFETSNRVVSLMCIVQGTVGFLFFALSEFVPTVIMKIYTNIPDVYEQGVMYLRAIAPYYLLVSIGEIYIGFMRNVKDVTKGSRFVITSQLVNCALNGFLIFGLCGLPRLGIVGAGISTSVSGLVLIVLAGHEYIRSDLLRLTKKDFTTISKELWKEFTSFTMPMVAQHISFFAACNAISAIVGHMNTEAVSAQAVRSTVYNLVRSIDNGVGTIAALIMSPYMVLTRKDKAIKNAELMIGYLVKVAAVMVVIFTASRLIVPYVFGSLTDKTLYYVNILWCFSIFTVFFASLNNGIRSSVLFPSGDIKALLIIDTVVMWGFIVLGMVIAFYVFKLPVGVVIAFLAFDEIISFPFKYIRYKSLKWCNKLK